MSPQSRQQDNTGAGFSSSVRHAIAGCFAFAVFCVALVAGRFAENPTSTILERGLIAMILAFPLGHLIGYICEFTIKHELLAYVRNRPVPDSDVSPEQLLEQMRASTSTTDVPNGEAGEDGSGLPGRRPQG